MCHNNDCVGGEAVLYFFRERDPRFANRLDQVGIALLSSVSLQGFT